MGCSSTGRAHRARAEKAAMQKINGKWKINTCICKHFEGRNEIKTSYDSTQAWLTKAALACNCLDCGLCYSGNNRHL